VATLYAAQKTLGVDYISILKESIEKLKKNNELINKRLSKTTNKEKINNLNMTIAKNNSMILDYEFQLNNC
jgi:hypothetical protein